MQCGWVMFHVCSFETKFKVFPFRYSWCTVDGFKKMYKTHKMLILGRYSFALGMLKDLTQITKNTQYFFNSTIIRQLWVARFSYFNTEEGQTRGNLSCWVHLIKHIFTLDNRNGEMFGDVEDSVLGLSSHKISFFQFTAFGYNFHLSVEIHLLCPIL